MSPRGRATADVTGDEGITLVELQVSAVIAILVGVLGLTVMTGTMRAGEQLTSSTQRFDAGIVATERLSGDLRDARVLLDTAGAPLTAASTGVVDENATPAAAAAVAPATSVRLWLDGNADYVQQPAERIAWAVTGGQLCRLPEGGTQSCVAVAGHTAEVSFTFLRSTTTGAVHQVRAALTWIPAAGARRDADTRLLTVDLENAR
ncbi:hypothetical protein NUM3379_04890 [Kineococcus sp. NUM-3379]